MKKILSNIATLAITLIAVFIILEVCLGIFYPQKTELRVEKISPKIFTDSDYTPWALKPNSMDRQISPIGNEFNVEVKINSYGLRDDEIYPYELEEKTIFGAIGDSMTFGSGVEFEETYHQQLEKMFGNNYRVLNFGRADGSLSTDVQYLYLKNKGFKFNPKIIILGFYVGNDITDTGKKTTWVSIDNDGNPTNITTGWTYIDEEGRYRRNYDISTEGRGLFYRFNRFMSEWSHLYMLFKSIYIENVLANPEASYVMEYPNDFQEKIELSEKLLLEINKLAEENGAILIVLLMPARVQVSDKEWETYERLFDNAYRYNPQEELTRFFSENGVRYVDLLPSFMGHPELYYRIDGHWNEKGHEMAAVKLYEYLVNEGLYKG